MLNRFTEVAAIRAVRDELDGIIYGHSHVSMLKYSAKNIIANCGSWTLKEDRANAHSAIIETTGGQLELRQWPMMRRPKNHKNRQNIPLNEIVSRHRETIEILTMVHHLCCKPQLIIPYKPIHQSL